MPTPAITFSRMLGFLRFGPRSWGGDDSRQHPLTPPRVKLPSPPTPKQSQQRAEPQPLALCWGLEGLIVVLVSQQAKTFPVLLFKLASFPHRTLPLSSGDRCDIPNRGRRIHQRQRSAGAAKWPGPSMAWKPLPCYTTVNKKLFLLLRNSCLVKHAASLISSVWMVPLELGSTQPVQLHPGAPIQQYVLVGSTPSMEPSAGLELMTLRSTTELRSRVGCSTN
ncbi:uncharacterized protein LOC131509943 isoform X4 [Neofelis nebulosa]|uniref:uncharacterized protein LOC131509943 isoform X4 n=1 Tax=Neofelis nebulosa TaxID=61452 RepID=UPI002729CF6A|nr:uncharacterized protein LOC131509943 isoform X4 [Neofelis nebulosa]